ncbi:MAG TPA: S8 family serine peptidase [Tepidiformaceae bacterium]|nr:S8 family serine peptidase [Tepidiformaceae bacterium]
MRARWLGIFALVLAATTGAATTTLHEPIALAEAPEAYVDVQFDTGVSAQELRADGLPPTLAEQGFRRLAVPKGKTAGEFLAELRARPDVISAVRDAPVYAAGIPDDPYYNANQAQYLGMIGAPGAWDIHTGSSQVVVAVIDSGLDVTHPEFAGRLWENPIDNQSDGIDRDGNKCTNDRYGCRYVSLTTANAALCGYTSSLPTGNILDDMGSSPSNIGSHGTLVSGIIGAAGDNGQGIAGVAWDVKLMTVKVLDCQGEGRMADVADGIEYAVRNGARIINVSVASKPGDQDADSPRLRAALQLAQDSGVIVVAAAGNHPVGSSQVGTAYPAAYTEFPSLIAVGASNNLNDNIWAAYSNYGPAIDFAAPGNKLVSTTRTDIGLANPYAEIGDARDGYEGGTSFSTPLVSGTFALMMSRNSRLAAADYIKAARDAATPAEPAPHGQNWAGSGIINMAGAVARVPMSISGAPLKDWKDVPGGTAIQALIESTECGSTTAQAFGRASTYSIKVRSAAESPGCGLPGRTVTLYIGGAPAKPALAWPGANEDIGLVSKDVSTVSPGPGAIVVQQLNGQWSNIAHLEPTGNLPGAASSLPTPWKVIYRWDPLKMFLDRPGGYRRFARLAPAYASDYPQIQQYDAYWVDAPATNLASPNPNPAPGRAIELQPGWNNFTYTGTSKAVAEALAGVKYTQVLQFDNPTNTWLSHLPGQPRYVNDFGGLFQLKVYWIYVSEPATLVMN